MKDFCNFISICCSDTHSVDKDLSVRENGDVDSDAVSLESTTPTFTLGHSSSTELLAESDGAASSSIEFFETSNVSLVEEVSVFYYPCNTCHAHAFLLIILEKIYSLICVEISTRQPLGFYRTTKQILVQG